MHANLLLNLTFVLHRYNQIDCLQTSLQYEMVARYYILPFSLNSECLSLTEIVSLLTLCLAPLITHIASGSASVSYLVNDRPQWYEKACHYNPTSILWRYAAITDRRIRATSWDKSDMAVSNAIFWTSRGWDGSEEIASIAGAYCFRLPQYCRAEILSSAMFKTVLTTAQGVSALYWIVYHLVDSNDTDSFISLAGVDNIFMPLALFGLLRLCAAAWLTDDYAYAPRSDLHFKPLPTTHPAIPNFFQRPAHATKGRPQVTCSTCIESQSLQVDKILAIRSVPDCLYINTCDVLGNLRNICSPNLLAGRPSLVNNESHDVLDGFSIPRILNDFGSTSRLLFKPPAKANNHTMHLKLVVQTVHSCGARLCLDFHRHSDFGDHQRTTGWVLKHKMGLGRDRMQFKDMVHRISKLTLLRPCLNEQRFTQR